MPHIFSYCFSPCSPFPRFGVKLLKKYLKPQSSFCSSNQTPPPPKKKIAMVVHQLYKPHSQLFFMLKVCEKESFRWYKFSLDVSLDLSCGLVCVVLNKLHWLRVYRRKTFRKVKWLMMMAPSSSILGQIRQTKQIFALASLQKAFRKHLP